MKSIKLTNKSTFHIIRTGVLVLVLHLRVIQAGPDSTNPASTTSLGLTGPGFTNLPAPGQASTNQKKIFKKNKGFSFFAPYPNTKPIKKDLTTSPAAASSTGTQTTPHGQKKNFFQPVQLNPQPNPQLYPFPSNPSSTQPQSQPTAESSQVRPTVSSTVKGPSPRNLPNLKPTKPSRSSAAKAQPRKKSKKKKRYPRILRFYFPRRNPKPSQRNRKKRGKKRTRKGRLTAK